MYCYARKKNFFSKTKMYVYEQVLNCKDKNVKKRYSVI